MSDFEKPDMPSDTQDTFFEESESDCQFIKNRENTSACTGDSQDFHLLDTGDSQEFEADLSEAPTNDSEAVKIDKESALSEKAVDDESKEDSFENKNQSIEGQEEEDEDVVHGTPPHCLSSPSKKLNTIADIKSLKRRADSMEDSIENPQLIKRNKIDNSQDVLQNELAAMEDDTLLIEDVNEDSQKQIEIPEGSLIIPETQDSMQDTEPINTEAINDLEETEDIVEAENHAESAKNLDLGNDNSLEEECDLVNEAIDSVDDGNKNQNDSTTVNFAEGDISNQNEVSVDDGELSQSKNVSKEIDFSEDVSFTEEGDGKEDSKESENVAENEAFTDVEEQTKIMGDIENKTEDIEQEENLEKSGSEIEELEKPESIEDALKQLGEETDATEPSEPPPVEKESTESELLAVLTDSDTNAEVDEGSDNKNEAPVQMETEDIPETKVKEESDKIAKSRMSIEVIYDRSSLSQEIKAKPAEVVEIDDDGEKIILDSSQEDENAQSDLPSDMKDETIYKSCHDSKTNSDFSYKSVTSSKDSVVDQKTESLLTNGDDSKKTELDTTASVKSNESLDGDSKDKFSKEALNAKSETGVPNPPFFVISDSEGDSMLENKSSIESNALASTAKTLQVEKEVSVCVRLKCLVTIDENTKEILGKELLGVNCETVADQMRHSDTSTSLADISGNDNKDSSPGSVTSTTYPRFSIMSTSTVSSSTSSSSAGSLPSKISSRDKMFSVPKGPAKHTKKLPYDEKSNLDLDQLTKEWKNPQLVTMSVLNFVNAELSGVDLQNGVADSLDEPLRKMHSSTPEANKETPQRNSKKGRPPKRLQSRGSRKRTKVVATKTSPNVIDPIQEDSDDQSSSTLKETKSKSVTSGSSLTPVKKPLEGLRNAAPPVVQGDQLLGKEVFAKWSDNNYYSGIVVDKTKAKYKVNFNDGKSKQLISEFVVPIPRTLNKGLSVYTLTKDGDYGPCGIIVDVLEANNKVSYVIEPDEGKRITVQIKDIFLTSDQAQVLKEEVCTEPSSLPSTPHSISQVSLDNMIDGKRRSRRYASTTHTPKSKKSLTSLMGKSSDNEPSVSGVVLKSKEAPVSEKDGKTSDSNCSVVEESGIHGVQKEIIGTTSEQVTTKGPQSRIKGKQRNRKKPDDQETIDLLGPIPEPNSKIFEGMSFLLTCASVEGIDRYHIDNGGDSNSETGTENEEEWQSRPFVRDRLEQQLVAGGGKVYDNFDLIPASEYENTKLITNVPNLTAKSLLCLSVGISAYNHMWVIRSCKDNKAVNPSEEKLPAGWSIDRRSYVEMFHRRDQKPLTHIIVVIPCKEDSDKEFVSFWSRICENAGGTVRVVDNPEISFIEGTVVLSNHRCPTWVIEKAEGWEIPLVSTTWLVQSLIEGKILTYDGHKRFKLF